jgi:hypothetical protein
MNVSVGHGRDDATDGLAPGARRLTGGPMVTSDELSLPLSISDFDDSPILGRITRGGVRNAPCPALVVREM